jgi:uncharacterized protein YraI
MKKRIVLRLVLPILLITVALAAQTTILKVRVQVANIRTGPEIGAPVLRTVPLGTLLEAVEKSGDWYKISIEDDQGRPATAYINAVVVDVIGGGEAGEAEPEAAVEQEPEQEQEAVEPEPAPVRTAPRRPARYGEDYDRPKSYGGGGVRLLGGLSSTNILYNEDHLNDVSGGNDFGNYIKPRTSYVGGIGFEMGSRLSLEIDFLYMPKGVKLEGGFDASSLGGGKVDFKADLIANAVTVPVLLKLRILPGSTPFVLAGGEVGYLLTGTLDWSYTSGGKTEKGKEDLLKEDENGDVAFNRLDYGAVFGGGFELRLAGLTLTVEGRYHLGQANLLKMTKAAEAAGQTSADYMKTKALVVLAGLKF